MSEIYERPEMIKAFLDELEEEIQFLEKCILELETNETTENVIQDIFRAAHTLKGSSSAMGYEKMKLLTHEMENVFDKIRNNLLKVTKPMINLLFKCIDCLTLLKEDFLAHKNETQIEIKHLVHHLKEIQENSLSKKEEHLIRMDIKKEDIIFDLDIEQKNMLKAANSKGYFSMVCEIKILEDSLMKSIRALLILNWLNEIGNVIASLPNVLELSPDDNVDTIKYLLTTELDNEVMLQKIKENLMDIDDVKVFSYKIQELNKNETNETIVQSRKNNELEENKDKFNPKKNDNKISKTIRVDVDRLEHMMNLVGEMVIEQTRIAQVSSSLHNRYIADDSVEDLIGISGRISRVVSELQESIMKARMLPVQQLFSRFPRLVRDLANSLEKDIDLILEGGETEMDRTIIEDITDPLIHLVRNSLDHGIEKPSIRIDKGKPSKGTLRIKAFHQENHVIVTVEDDGAGLNIEKIKQSAIKKEVVSAQEAEILSEQEIINLIFKTGLSTANNVSDVSGRGVGMDIVRNHIDKLNGIIDVETKEGEGSKFTIKLPLTLAILAGLLVKIHNETYALPMSNIIEIVRKPKGEIEYVKNQSVVVIRDKVLPIIWLHDYFKLPKENKKKNVFIIVLGIAEKRFGIVVDELVGNQEIVVKPLGAYIGKIEGISGATILGDGSVAHIFDVVGISRMINNKGIKDNNNFNNNEI
ncbi:chemotaxis protein CheA [Clostridium saccharobutylicum]|uniref:Chemotaxis protein CheA n=3 Tax=Clostridium saccharobutylicum TaxID=169679 RepID=U5MV10_CLOSA|nr:chemotaxis protein CheA [Clostridium saccharobutylicum]AGX43302.1 chemotaxis protein CheA [Clostridium saccharobutylicum DSM 13864]AQR90602.1 chemotaxis protein CheA [Clostridium saccharobutylicum]AQS00506.1 chemotaxis protein CheA [Clostridium saccharobutylicum]AQS10157.1 chemotaxis protein CheA [Clostridium saccharobutylicum]AQS14489.1 chemotaxis protein CheA [Clostridium saccharobutylicum]